MTEQINDMWTKLRSTIQPIVLLLGVLISFGLCSLAGKYCAKNVQYDHFHRFYYFLNAESSFYPTISQMVALAEQKLKEGKYVVIVGGHSAAMGAGQGGEEIWSRRLGKMLGPEYAVLNFAMPCMSQFSGPYYAFLSLSRKYPRLFYVAVTWPFSQPFIEDVYVGYPYFFDAKYKNLLPPLPEAEFDINARAELLTDEQRIQLEEVKLGAQLDSFLYFRDLWTVVGYRLFFTVWNPRTGTNFLKARMFFPDDTEIAVKPFDKRFLNYDYDWDIKRIKIEWRPIYKEEKDGTYTYDSYFPQNYQFRLGLLTPANVRKNILLLTLKTNPYVLNACANDEEVKRLDLAHDLMSSTCEKAGIRCLDIGKDYSSEDYLDGIHLTPGGGAKMASTVSRVIKQWREEK